jgi:SAM-dependent methyltransferase
VPSARKRRAWSADNPGNIAIREEVAEAALSASAEALAGGGPVLDAGCGTGWWLRRLSSAGIAADRLFGIDRDPARVAAAAASRATVVEGDLRSLPYEDGRFAAVFLFTALSSLGGAQAVDRAAAEARRVLAPGGVIVIWEPRIPTPLNRSTRLIRLSDLRPRLGAPATVHSLTVLPPLARRVGDHYPRLARVPALHTHRLLVYQPLHVSLTSQTDADSRLMPGH